MFLHDLTGEKSEGTGRGKVSSEPAETNSCPGGSSVKEVEWWIWSLKQTETLHHHTQRLPQKKQPTVKQNWLTVRLLSFCTSAFVRIFVEDVDRFVKKNIKWPLFSHLLSHDGRLEENGCSQKGNHFYIRFSLCLCGSFGELMYFSCLYSLSQTFRVFQIKHRPQTNKRGQSWSWAPDSLLQPSLHCFWPSAALPTLFLSACSQPLLLAFGQKWSVSVSHTAQIAD